jgi:hypothetical protein
MEFGQDRLGAVAAKRTCFLQSALDLPGRLILSQRPRQKPPQFVSANGL